MQGDSARGIDLSEYETNPSWDIVDTSWKADFSKVESSITFSITLKRKPLYAILTIVFPLLLLSLLNIAAFILPSDGGEKSGYAVTIFLAFVVFLTIVESTLPPSSDTIAVFSIYIIMLTSMSTVITLVILAENRCNGWDVNEVPIPGWLKFLADVGRLKMCCKGCNRSDSKVMNVRSVTHVEKSLFDTDETEKQVDDGEDDEYDWKTVIYGFDRLMVMFFSLIAILANVLFFILATS